MSRMCEVLRVSRSGYYDWRQRQGTESKREATNRVLLGQIRDVFEASDQTWSEPATTDTSSLRKTQLTPPNSINGFQINGFQRCCKIQSFCSNLSASSLPRLIGA
ncbi:MAG: hypothetical protein ABEL51_09220, partial [Salinibacter sp.]